jgi:mono/diheme cytochrome c family protein
MSKVPLSGRGPDRSLSQAEHEESKQVEPIHLVAAAVREMSEPKDGFSPTPVLLLMVYFALAMYSGYYLAQYSGGFRPNIYSNRPAAGPASSEKPKAQDPMVLGKQVFNVCSQCHQETGQGIPGTYPPLAGSPIVLGDPSTPVRILLHGLEGSVVVGGSTYNGQMPSWNRFKDEQIAAVLTYVRNSWSNKATPVDPALVAVLRRQTSDRQQPWTFAELQTLAAKPAVSSELTAHPGPKE